MIRDDILGTVGRTPMCRLGKIVPATSAEVVAKLEFFEPGGSIKDRAAVSMLDAAQRDGRLEPGMTVVEASGGNTGVGLAMACAVRGHPCVIVLPSDTSKEKIAVLRAFGAEVIRARIDVPGAHAEGYVGRAKAYARDHGAFLPDQFMNPANPAGPRDLHRARDPRAVRAASSTRSSRASARAARSPAWDACSARVCRAFDRWRCDAGALGRRRRDGRDRRRRDPRHAARSRDPVSDVDAIRSMLRLAREEGILAGASSGVALVAALRVAAELGPAKRVVTMVTDTGRNYLSTYFDPEWRRARGFDV